MVKRPESFEVECSFFANLVSSSTSPETGWILTRLQYSLSDQLSLHLRFGEDPHVVDWVFGFDIFKKGLTEKSGDGDVTVFPSDDGDLVYLTLSSPVGTAIVEMTYEDADLFVKAKEAFVPDGQEDSGVDTWADKLLS